MKQNKYGEESAFQHLRRNLKGLTFEQKIDHILRYYWGTLLLMILIPTALGLFLGSLFRDRPDLIFSGNCCNVTLSEEGSSYLINDWSAQLNMEPGTLQLNLRHTVTEGTQSLDVDQGVQVLASIAANDLDYILCDSVGAEFFTVQRAFLPLDLVLDQETLAQWSDKIYPFTDPEDGITYDAALDVTELPFIRNSVREDGRVYLFFAHKENADPQLLQRFLSHLTSWDSADGSSPVTD